MVTASAGMNRESLDRLVQSPTVRPISRGANPRHGFAAVYRGVVPGQELVAMP